MDLGSNECDNSPFQIDEKRYSSLQKLIRVTSYCARFLQKRNWSVLRKETQETISSRYVCIDQTSVQKPFKLCFRPSSQCLYGMYTLGIRSSE